MGMSSMREGLRYASTMCGEPSVTFLDDVICSGSESSLLDCTRASTVNCYTGHQEDAGVRCYSKSVSLIPLYITV